MEKTIEVSQTHERLCLIGALNLDGSGAPATAVGLASHGGSRVGHPNSAWFLVSEVAVAGELNQASLRNFSDDSKHRRPDLV